MTWSPPPYPYDRLAPLRDKAAALPGGLVDLSIGDPTDPPPPAVVSALSSSGAERSYPTSVGSPGFRAAAAAWMERRLGVAVPPSAVASTFLICVLIVLFVVRLRNRRFSVCRKCFLALFV